MYRVGIFEFDQRIFAEYVGTGQTREAAEADLINQWVDYLCKTWGDTDQQARADIATDMQEHSIEFKDV